MRVKNVTKKHILRRSGVFEQIREKKSVANIVRFETHSGIQYGDMRVCTYMDEEQM